MKLIALFTVFLLVIGSMLIDAQFLSNAEKQPGQPAVYAQHSEHVGNWNPAARRRKRQFLSQHQPPSKTPANYAPQSEPVGNWNPK